MKLHYALKVLDQFYSFEQGVSDGTKPLAAATDAKYLEDSFGMRGRSGSSKST